MKCFFCQHSTRGVKEDLFIKKNQALQNMDFNMFKKIVADIMELPEQPKKIQLVGMGEPILNPDLPKMVEYLRYAGFNGRIVTYTNGLAITADLAKQLADSGLTSIQVSVYGITTDDFLKFSGVSVDMERYLANIKSLYDNKGNMQVRLKTTDDVADTEEKKEKFFTPFNDICDQIFIEHIINIPNQMGLTPIKVRNVTQYSEELHDYRQICPWMFYQAHINSDGDVFFCDILAKPKEYAIGNIISENFIDIWNGEKRRKLQRNALRYGQDALRECIGCDDRYSMTAPEEYLDDCREMLIRKLGG